MTEIKTTITRRTEATIPLAEIEDLLRGVVGAPGDAAVCFGLEYLGDHGDDGAELISATVTWEDESHD